METLNLSKKIYSKSQYDRVINTDFSQLASSPSIADANLNIVAPAAAISEFFANYKQIFFTIPKLGATDSHEYLIKTSAEYIGTNPASNEINILQQQNLELNQQIIDLQLPK